MGVYASADAQLTVAGHLEAEVAVSKWEVQQTYPQNDQHPLKALESPDYDGTQTVGKPSFDASVATKGDIALHLKPQVTFGIVFDDRWKVDPCNVDLVLDGYAIAHAEASASTSPTTRVHSPTVSMPDPASMPSCPHLNYLAEVANNRSLSRVFPGNRLPRTRVLGAAHVDHDEFDPLTGNYISPFVSDAGDFQHMRDKRDIFSIGPAITIPDSFLSCPGDDSSNATECPFCTQEKE